MDNILSQFDELADKNPEIDDAINDILFILTDNITDKNGNALYNERNFNISVINALKIGYISGYNIGLKAKENKKA